jgi:hypothetical protein
MEGCSSLHLYKGTPCGKICKTKIPRRSHVLRPSLSLSHMCLLCPLSPVWLPEGLRRSEVNSMLHTVVLRKFRIRSKLIYFHNLDRDLRSGGRHHSLYVYKTSEVLHSWRRVVAPVLSLWCHNIKFYMTLRLASSVSSSIPMRGCNPHVQSTRVRHRSLANRYRITNR